jgi:hypothetical protein
MSNLIPMDEAARILGMTVEEVTELRSNNEIFGYKDGANWKFKMSELERVAGEMDIKLNLSEAANVASDLSESFGFDLSESSGLLMDDLSGDDIVEDLDSAEYMEDSSVELASPTFGAPLSGDDSEDDLISLDGSDLKLEDSGLLDQKSASDTAKTLGADFSENVLDDEDDKNDELSFGSSSLSLASDSRKMTDDDLQLSSDTDKAMAASDSGLLLGDDDEFSFSDDSSSFEESAELSSDFEDSGNLILDDSDSSAEITLEANESGINLAASSSGISLDDSVSLADSGALNLEASDIDLPEDDDEIVVLEDDDAPVMLEDDDFNLTPLDTSMDEDDSSGSQVIALEDSEIYADDSAATILGDDDGFGMPVDGDAGFADDGFGYGDAGVAGGMVAAGAAGMAGAVAIEEAPYSTGQLVSLGLTLTVMLLGGMVAYNLAQNLWMPTDPVGDSVLTFFLSMVGAD